LLSIINDIVDISNIEASRVKVNPERCDLSTVFLKLYDQFSLRAALKGIKLDCRTPGEKGRIYIYTDETKLIQILSNLLNNAIKFTREGKIEYGFTIKAGKADIYVKDTGIGIDQELHGKVFERFYQVPDDSDHKSEGTGLGLSICKAYVGMLGGEIRLQSTPGKGSVFSFTLPLKQD
jgi:signal transduction histidine kinase